MQSRPQPTIAIVSKLAHKTEVRSAVTANCPRSMTTDHGVCHRGPSLAAFRENADGLQGKENALHSGIRGASVKIKPN